MSDYVKFKQATKGNKRFVAVKKDDIVGYYNDDYSYQGERIYVTVIQVVRSNDLVGINVSNTFDEVEKLLNE